MKKLLLLAMSVLLNIASQAQRNPIEEGTKKFGSKEILLLTADSVNQAVTNQRLFSFNWRGYFTNQQPFIFNKYGPKGITNATTSNNHVSIAEAADLNGDGIEEPIYLLEKTSYWVIAIGNITSSLDSANRTYNFTISNPTHQLNTTHTTISGNPNKYYPVLLTGNFDTDAQQEFAVAFKDPTAGTIKIVIFDTDGTLTPIARDSVSSDTSPFLGYGDAYNLATADLDADGKDEIVLLASESNSNNANLYFPYSLYLKTYAVNSTAASHYITQVNRQVLSSNLDHTGLDQNHPDFVHTSLTRVKVKDSNGNYINDRIVASYYFIHSNFNGNNYYNNFTYVLVPSTGMTSLDITAIDSASNKTPNSMDAAMTLRSGDFDGTYPNEVVVRVGDCRVYSVRNDSLIFQQSFSGSNLTDWTNSIDGMEMADVDADGKDEVVLFYNFTNQSGNYKRFQYDVVGESGTQATWTFDENTGLSTNMSALAIGNFDGSDFRLGTPIVSTCSYRMPIMIIGTVPTHVDYLNGTLYDICGCWQTGSTCPFTTTNSNSGSQGFQSSVSLKSDWSVSASANAGVSFAGVDVGASMEASYGQNFSNDISDSTYFTVTTVANTTNDDILQCREVPMKVYEYPVVNSFGQTVDHLLAAFPTGNTGTDVFFPSRSNANYLPDHEVGNLLSYPSDEAYSSIEDFAVDSGLNKATILPVGSSTAYVVSSSGTYTQTVTVGSSFSSTNATGWNAGVNAEVSASGFGMGMSVKGMYNMSGMRVSSQQITRTQDFIFNIGHYSGANYADYRIKPRIYWNQDGAAKINWKVDPDVTSGSFYVQNYGGKSDPALLMPWRLDPILNGVSATNPRVSRTKSMYFEPLYPNLYDTVTIYLKVYNYSLISTPAATEVSFYSGDPATGGTIIRDLNGDSLFTVGVMAARGRQTLQVKFIANDTLLKKIYAVLDPRNLNNNEVHEENNKGWAYVGYDCNVSDGVIGIEDVMVTKADINLKVYPNPSNGEVSLSFKPMNPGKITIDIFDLFGRKISDFYANYLLNEEIIIRKDLHDLNPGLYLIRLRSENGMDVSVRLVKI